MANKLSRRQTQKTEVAAGAENGGARCYDCLVPKQNKVEEEKLKKAKEQ